MLVAGQQLGAGPGAVAAARALHAAGFAAVIAASYADGFAEALLAAGIPALEVDAPAVFHTGQRLRINLEGGTIAKNSDDPVARVNAILDEIERMGDPEHVAKRSREDALAKWKAEPLPPKTLGAGASLAISKEKIETMAKANGYGMSEAEWKRGLA